MSERYYCLSGEITPPDRHDVLPGCPRAATMDGSVVPGCYFNDSCWYVKDGHNPSSLKKHRSDELMIFIGSDFNNRSDLGAEIVFRLENDIMILTRSCMVFIPAGTAHGIIEIRNLKTPVLSSTCFYDEDLYEDSDAEPSAPEGKYARHLIENYDPTGKKTPPDSFWPILWLDRNKLDNAPYMEVLWFGQEGFNGPVTHTHGFDEVIGFLSPDPDSPGDLPAEIHYDVDFKTIKSTKSMYIFIPRDIPHSPIYAPKVGSPIIHFSGGGRLPGSGEYALKDKKLIIAQKP